MTAPRSEGISTGMPDVAPELPLLRARFAAASRHSRLSPSIAGAITRIISGSWKYMYAISTPVLENGWNPSLGRVSDAGRFRSPHGDDAERAEGRDPRERERDAPKFAATPEKVVRIAPDHAG